VALAAQPALFASGQGPSPAALRGAQSQLMRDATLQFNFASATPPPRVTLPHWLQVLDRWLGQIFGALGHVLGWVFVGGLVLALLVVLFFLLREFMQTRWPDLFKQKKPKPAKPVDWRPEAAVARALLDEADKLAAAGAYAEAVRLILHRSIEEIEGRRPRLVKARLHRPRDRPAVRHPRSGARHLLGHRRGGRAQLLRRTRHRRRRLHRLPARL
jgi:hypothetical protein